MLKRARIHYLFLLAYSSILFFSRCQPLEIDLLCDISSKTFQTILTLKAATKDESGFCGYSPKAITSNSNISNTASSYRIGGNVTGLSGSVTLQNNNTENIIITQNGFFNFIQLIADNTSYSVVVTINPPNQICSITNGSGNVNGADVTNITVTCISNSTSLYKIGGNVTGLSGSVTLQNNNAESITITQDGFFNFAQALADNAAYSVSVITNPVNQNCSIANGSGIVQGANVTNIGITCGSNSKTLTALSIPSLSITGTINGLGVTMIAPPTTTNLTGLIPTFTHTGASVKVNGTTITSGISAVDFTNPVAFTVVAADGSTQIYTVAVYAPRAINGIGLWLRADSMALANGANVNPWNDSSGNGNNFPGSGSATFQTAVINGLPVVRIAGFGFGLGAGSPTGLYIDDSGSFFSVSKINGAPGTTVSILTLGGCPNGGRGFLFQATTGKLTLTRYCNLDNLIFNTSPGFTNFRIHSVLQNGTSLVNGYLDGSLDATTNTIGAPGQGYNNFGSGNYVYYIANSSGGTDFGNMDIAEILFYNVFLNATDMKKVHCYLSIKYALPLNGVSCP